MMPTTENQLSLFPCTRCGRMVDISLFRPGTQHLQAMCRNKECFECSFWRYMSEHLPVNSIVVDGELIVPQFVEDNPFTAIIKRPRYIVTESGHTIKANNVVSYGMVPEYFAETFPTTAHYVSHKLYRTMSGFEGTKCRKRGCYDRYHCFFYDISIEAAHGPWNEIPKDYQPGWEDCPSFINKHTIFNK